MKKTALTMTDSQKTSAERIMNKINSGKVLELPATHPKTLEEENEALRNIVEEQELAMDMIMRKYREQVDRLTKLPHVDVGHLHYKRYLDTIINQANKMDKMTKMMRRNLLVILKYEEVMTQIESENESLRFLVKKLTLAAKDAEKKQVKKNDAESQTNLKDGKVSTVDKSVETSMAECGEQENAPEKEDKCTEMMVYTPFPDSFAYFATIHNTRPLTKPLDVDAAFDLYVNRFSEETEKPTDECVSLHNTTSNAKHGNSSSDVDDSEKLEDLFEEPSTSALLTEMDGPSTENSIISLIDDDS